MKSWLTKFRISNELDAGLGAPAAKPQSLARCDESRCFEQTIHAVDRGLRSRPPVGEPPADLHAGIMSAVRENRGIRRTGYRVSPAVGWFAAPAFAALVLAGLWWTFRPAGEPPVRTEKMAQASILQMGNALEGGDSAARNLAPAMVAPLAEELGRVNVDIENAARFLVASLP